MSSKFNIHMRNAAILVALACGMGAPMIAIIWGFKPALILIIAAFSLLFIIVTAMLGKR